MIRCDCCGKDIEGITGKDIEDVGDFVFCSKECSEDFFPPEDRLSITFADDEETGLH